ncbi:hypothetical protein [Lutibaculum baratangense]|uniref:Lipoprotein n=1 Tax=Lutibaculum baratangense AMV1 TaxID=631454 RepID=V4RHX4_9HYPH|nr:hypothetical protein [Lutibaculum baratangense]ESR22865.1 hypothetical protein N177_4002 [Lutibaculum baratangense AMV1]
MPAAKHLVLGALVIVAAGLSACRDDALERDYISEKGVYEGPADTPLTAEQQRELEQRALRQKF